HFCTSTNAGKCTSSHKRGSLIVLSSFSVTGLMTHRPLTSAAQEGETAWPKQNVRPIAETLEITTASAAVLQATFWPNPTLSVDEVNLWASRSQIEIGGEELPPLFGDFGKHQQFSIGLEQLIQTAGKRKKLMALEQVSVDKAAQYFEDLLRNLKIEFRNQLTELQFLQFHKKVYDSQIDAISQLTQSYSKQVDLGHFPKGEFVRLKALELQFAKSSKDLGNEINEAQKELKQLMRLSAETHLVITEEDFLINADPFKLLNLN